MKPLLGHWRILGSDGWDSNALDLVAEAHIEIQPGGHGSFLVIAVEAGIDWRSDPDGRTARFS